MDKFISALEQENPGAMNVLIAHWWPERNGNFVQRQNLRSLLHGASMFLPSHDEAESEMTLLGDVAHEYIMEAIQNDNA